MQHILARFTPLVETFFVAHTPKGLEALGSTGTMHVDTPPVASAAAPSNQTIAARVAALGPMASGTSPAMASDASGDSGSVPSSSSSSSDSAAVDAIGSAANTSKLMRFVKTNQVLLNCIIRRTPAARLLLRGPLRIMTHPPARHCLEFDNKRSYFRAQLKAARARAMRASSSGPSGRRADSIQIHVRRNYVMVDSFSQLSMRSAQEMRGRLSVTFEGEDGVDAGGLTREWYSILAREMFNPNYALFIASHDSPTFQPNPHSSVNHLHLQYFRFVGRVIGKAIYDGQHFDAYFTRSFYKHMLGLAVVFEDIQSVDPQYFKSMKQLIDLDVVSAELDFNFTAELMRFGQLQEVELKPGGRDIVVTNENKMEYIQLITANRMTTQIKPQIDAFLEGFHELIGPKMLSIFNADELELLISGMPTIDLDDLRANTIYHTYHASDQNIKWFWEALTSLSEEETAKFLQFVTGTSKVPLEGFKALRGMRGPQKFNVHKAFGGCNRLPSAHTCFNQLDLPVYESKEQMLERIQFVLSEGTEGFAFA